MKNAHDLDYSIIIIFRFFLGSCTKNSAIEQQADLVKRIRRDVNTALSNQNPNTYQASYTSSNTGNGIACTTECRRLSGYQGKTDAEMDALARQVTNSIVEDIRSGKLQHTQFNQPNWLANRVADQVNTLNQDHQFEFERNVQAAANRFQQNRQHFSIQSQQQQQGNSFQQQSQSQHNFGYIQPVQGGSHYEKIIEEHHRTNKNFAQPMNVYNGAATILRQDNCTNEIIKGGFPMFNIQNRFNQVAERESNRLTNNVAPVFVRPIGGSSVTTFSQNIERKEHRVPQMPIVIPTQNTFTRQFEEQQHEIRRQEQRPHIFGINQQNRTSHSETSNVRNVQVLAPVPTPITTHVRHDLYEESDVVPNYRPRVVIDQNHVFQELEIRNRQHEYQPVLPTTQARTHVKEEEHFDRQIHQAPIFQPTIETKTVTKDEVETNYRQNRIQPQFIPTQSTRVEETERVDRQYQQRPINQPQLNVNTVVKESSESKYHRNRVQPQVYPTQSTQIKEEEEIDEQYHQAPVYRPTIETKTVTNEEVESTHRQHQQPVQFFPTQNTITHTDTEDVERIHQTKQPQYPVFTTSSTAQSFNESRESNHNTQTIYQPSNGQTVTTVKETHFVRVLPQPANQHTVQYTEREYSERLNRIQEELRRLGYGKLTEDEYNATIACGGFIHNGYKYLYNADHGRYEKSERVEVTEEEYHSLLRDLQNELHQLGIQMTEREYNQTIEDGYFEENGVRHNYDSETGAYNRQEITEEQYEALRHIIQNEAQNHGWSLTSSEINQTIVTGNLVINGHRYTLNKHTGQFEQSEEITISEQEYRTILRQLQRQLEHLGFEQMTEAEYNQTIRSGYFVRDGHKYQYNADVGIYERVEYTTEEYSNIVNRLKGALQRLNYRQMSEKEYNETISSGAFIRGGYVWSYDIESGDANAIRVVGPFEELSDTEYTAIYRSLQTLLRSLGYPNMSEIESNTTISRGSFSRGGNQYVYQPPSGEFQRIELSQTEYNYRVNKLIDILHRLGIQKSSAEYRDIINRGCFYHGGVRYEYDTESGQFEHVQMSEEEYHERVRQLLDQLHRIGYGTMTDSECRATINSGIFYYGGHEWVYDYRTGQYEMGAVSDKENGIVDDNYFQNIGHDSTQYGSSRTTDQISKPSTIDIDRDDQNPRRNEKIDITRGDLPPQILVEDYDDSVEKVVVPTEAATPRPTTPRPRMPRPTTPRSQPIILPPAPTVDDSMSQYYRREEQQQQQAVYPVPTQQSYEQRYHRKKTSYTKTSGYVWPLSTIFFMNNRNVTFHVFYLFLGSCSDTRHT